ncbi:hemolysin [Kwoniella heveanensis CBS 569]|nr:hemolysin [Kwoniella heveanensis CBS 569]
MPPLRRSALSSLPTLLSLTKLVHIIPNQSTWSSATTTLAAAGPPPIEPEDPPDSPAFWWKLGLSVVFVLSGGVFAGLTLALMGSDDLNLRVLSTSSSDPKERKSANKVLRLLSRGRHWVLVVLLLSNVIVNESLPIFLDDVLGGGLYAVIVSTTMIVIFGEIIPQAICVRYGLAIGGACAPMVWFFMILFSPIAWPTAKLLDYILGTDEGHTYKKAELKSFLQFHREGEEPLRDDEISILNGVLSLNEKHAKEIMTPIKDCLTLSADKVLDHEAIDQILLSGFSRIPVHEPGQPDNFVGMLLVKRLITYNPDDEWPVSKFSLLPLPEAKPEINCFQALDYFQTGRAHLLLISETPGQKGGALGIVSLEDLIEEIIGEEIVDETDRYEDNHSKKVVKRSGPAAVMRGIIERRRVINAFSRRPSRSSTFPSASQTPGSNGNGSAAPATTNNTTDGILVQIDNGNLVAEPVGFTGSGNHTEGDQENVKLDPSNKLVIGPDTLNGLTGASGNGKNEDKKDKPSGVDTSSAPGAMSPIAETSPTGSTSTKPQAEAQQADEGPSTTATDLLEVPPATAGDGNGDAAADLSGSAESSVHGSGTSTPREGEGNDEGDGGEGEGESQALLGGESKNGVSGSGGSGNGGTASKKKKKGKKGRKDRS